MNAAIPAVVGALVGWLLTSWATVTSGRLRAERALWRLEAELSYIRTIATFVRIFEHDSSLVYPSEDSQNGDARRARSAETARRYNESLPMLNFYLEGADSIALGLGAGWCREIVEATLSRYNANRRAFPNAREENLRPLSTLEAIVSERRRFVGATPWIRPWQVREYLKARRRLAILKRQYYMATQPEEDLVEEALAELYQGDRAVLGVSAKHEQRPSVEPGIVGYKASNYWLLRLRGIAPLTIRVPGAGDEPPAWAISALFSVFAELVREKAQPTEGLYFSVDPALYDGIEVFVTALDPELGPQIVRLGGTRFITVVGVRGREARLPSEERDIDKMLRELTRRNALLVSDPVPRSEPADRI